MLVLSRKVGESIVIGSEVTITVLEVRGDHARIGIQAPRSVSVHRQEVHDELVRTNRAATSTQAADLTRLPKPST
ncbi:MAG: carbon storage regulator CsrA [Microthrixaceae bacterium]|nr:carbon storage regulator CsrA [Microthrixaceae bacterium]